MGIVGLPKTWITDDVLLAADLNLINTTLYNEFNGNIDNNNIKAGANIDAAKLLASSIVGSKLADAVISDAKLDYTSAKVVRAGPNFVGSNGVRLARGAKAFTLVSGVVTVTITFSSDATDGNPAFSAAPIFTGGIEHTAGNPHFVWEITSRLASSVTIRIRSIQTTGTPGAVDGGDNSSGTFGWLAMGAV